MKTRIMKNIILILLSLILIHCKKETSKKETIELVKPKLEKHDIKFVITDINPKSKIELDIDGKITLIAKVDGICVLINKIEYADYKIPKTAISAYRSWWGGAGNYFYAIRKDNKVLVYSGWDAEEIEKVGYHWEIAKVINL